MIDATRTATDRRHLTAFFDTRAAAEETSRRLRALDLEEMVIRVTGGDDFTTPAASEPPGLWERIADFLMSDDDSATYAEGLRRGGFLVTVSDVPDAHVDRVVDILDDEGSVDLDERGERWRAEGWQGVADDESGAVREADAEGAGPTPTLGGTSMGDAAASGVGISEAIAKSETIASDRAARGEADDAVIPVIEERLRVGKRDMSLGRVRVRSYIVEEPVSREVTLRAERVEIERRPVDRALSASDTAFVDRAIEAEERAEEAVVEKEARVVEEIDLGKSSDERTETISETVRHTEVEVEDDRDAARAEPKIQGV